MSTRGHFEGSEMSSKVRDFRQKNSRQKCGILGPSSILILNTSSILHSQSSILDHKSQSSILILIIILNTSSILILNHILNLELPILNSCSKIATKVRDHRPKMSSKVRDSGQNVRTHRVQLFPALVLVWILINCQIDGWFEQSK